MHPFLSFLSSSLLLFYILIFPFFSFLHYFFSVSSSLDFLILGYIVCDYQFMVIYASFPFLSPCLVFLYCLIFPFFSFFYYFSVSSSSRDFLILGAVFLSPSVGVFNLVVIMSSLEESLIYRSNSRMRSNDYHE